MAGSTPVILAMSTTSIGASSSSRSFRVGCFCTFRNQTLRRLRTSVAEVTSSRRVLVPDSLGNNRHSSSSSDMSAGDQRRPSPFLHLIPAILPAYPDH